MTVKQLAKQIAHGNRAMKVGSYRSSPILKRKEGLTALFSLVFPTALLEFAKNIQRAPRKFYLDSPASLKKWVLTLKKKNQ